MLMQNGISCVTSILTYCGRVGETMFSDDAGKRSKKVVWMKKKADLLSFS